MKNNFLFLKKLDLYKIKTEYIKYLKQFDDNVCDPKDFGRTRPYVGILVLEQADFYYFAPLTSQINKSKFYTVKLYDNNNKPIASVRVNNLIPVHKTNAQSISKIFYKKYLESTSDRDRRYGAILENEYQQLQKQWISSEIKNKAKTFLREYKYNYGIRKICNNFPLLEQKALEYSKRLEKEQDKQQERERSK